MALIGFGKCSKFYFFIFSVVICEFICDCLTVLNKDNDDENTGQKNDNIINHNYKLNDHPLLQDLLKFLGSTFAGLILYIIYSKNEKNKEGELSIVEYEKKKVKGQAASIQDDSSEDKTDILFSSIGYNDGQYCHISPFGFETLPIVGQF